MASHSSLIRMYARGLTGKQENNALSNLLRNNSAQGCPGGGFQLDLGRKAGTTVKFGDGSSLEDHLDLIFLINSPKSLLRSPLLVVIGVGTKPYPFSKTLVSVSLSTFLLRLNTLSQQK